MINPSEAAQMTLLVFFGVVVSLMILRLIPGLLMRACAGYTPPASDRHAASAEKQARQYRSSPKEFGARGGHAARFLAGSFATSRKAGVRFLLPAGAGGPGHHCILDRARHRPDDVPALKSQSGSKGASAFIAEAPFPCLPAIFLDSFMVQCNHRPTPERGILSPPFDEWYGDHPAQPSRRLQSGGAMYRAMYRSVAACAALLPAIAAFPGQKSSSKTAAPKTPASVKLWVDSSSANSCEQATPASGDWMIRNNEGRERAGHDPSCNHQRWRHQRR